MHILRPALLCLSVLGNAADPPRAANGLDALRDQLRKAPAQDRLRASVALSLWSRKADSKAPILSQGAVSALVETGPQGLKVQWGKDLLRRAMAESAARSRNSESPTPIRDALASLDAPGLQGYFEAAPRLLQDLEQATLQEERTDKLDGRPCRLLRLRLDPKLAERDRKYIKELEATAQVWVDADGLPLAAEARVKMRGKALLVISFSTEEHEVYRFGRFEGHLVTLRHERETQGSGAGESGQTRRVVDLAYE